MDLAENREKRKEIRGSAKLRRLLGILAFFCALFTVAFSLVYLAVFLGNLSISSPISLPSQCKIVSSSQARLALAEAPNEALPSDCRPNFSGAWLTKDKFEVNKTYECWYTLGIAKVHIYQDGFFDCQAKDPSTVEMFMRYLILFMRILKSWYVSGVSYWHWKWEAVAGVIAGFFTSMISIIFFGLLRRLFSCIYQLSVARRLTLSLNKVRLRRVCFLIAYVSFTSWLAIQYFRRIGLPEIAVYYST